MQPTFGRRTTAPQPRVLAAPTPAPAVAEVAPAPRFRPVPMRPETSHHWVDWGLRFLFSPKGRVTRWQYRLVNLLCVGVLYGVVLIAKASRTDMLTATTGAINAAGMWFAWMELLFAMFIFGLALWCGIVSSIKRWHDIDKSAWWALFGCIPVIGWFAQSIACGWVGGTKGENRFGPAPR